MDEGSNMLIAETGSANQVGGINSVSGFAGLLDQLLHSDGTLSAQDIVQIPGDAAQPINTIDEFFGGMRANCTPDPTHAPEFAYEPLVALVRCNTARDATAGIQGSTAEKEGRPHERGSGATPRLRQGDGDVH